MINFINININNFGSWESLSFPLNEQGVVCIKGLTGAGKSGIFKALYWCLFGNTPDNILADEVRRGNKPTYVHLSLEKGKERFEIKRYRAHPKFKNKVDFTGPGIPHVDEDSYVKTVQTLINNFLGISDTQFLTTVYFSQRNFHHFHTLSDMGKKSFIESLTYGSLFEQCEEFTKEQVRKSEQRVLKLEGQLQGLEISIRNLRKQTIIRKRELHKKLRELRTEIQTLEASIRQCNESKKPYDDAQFQITTARSKVTRLEYQIETAEREVAQCSKSKKNCPTCGAEMPIKDHTKRLGAAKEDLIRLRKELKIANENHKTVKERYDIWFSYVNMIDEYSLAIDHAERQMETLKQSFVKQGSISNLRKKSQEVREEMESIRQKLSYHSFWAKGFGFNGLRSFVLANAIKYLSERTTLYLNHIMGNSIDFNLGITNGKLLAKCNERSYHSLSGGERQAIDLCTGLGLRDLAERYNKSRFNLLVLDEPFEGADVHLTAVAQDLLLRYAKPTTYLITHQSMEGAFDKVYEVKKSQTKSNLRKVY